MPANEISSGVRLRYLRACPVLEDLPEASLAALSQAMEPRTYPIRHQFHSLSSPTGDRPLRLILRGRVVERIEGGELRILGPGHVIGLEGAAKWIAEQSGGAPHGYRDLPTAAYVLDTCEMLELSSGRFHEVFGVVDDEAVRTHFLDAHAVRRLAEGVAADLRRTPYLFKVPHSRLLELIDGARIFSASPEPDFKSPHFNASQPSLASEVAVGVVLSGRFDMLSEKFGEGDPFVNFGHVLIRPRAFDEAHDNALGLFPKAVTTVRILTISTRRVEQMKLRHIDFRRAVENAKGGQL